MKQLLLFIICWISFSIAQSNAQDCGSDPTVQEMEFLNKKEPLMRSFNAAITRGIQDFPVKIHAVTKTNGTGGMQRQELLDAITELNSYYINANIRFVILNDINFIKSDDFYDLNSSKESDLTEVHDIKHVINIYFFNSIYKYGINICGYAPFPNEYSAAYNNDRIMLRNDCIRNGATLIHEMGHYFSLYHTHGNTNAPEKELVTRVKGKRNCETTGDNICDTAADPSLSGKVDADCRYTERLRDANGEMYTPNPRNIMAYSVIGCRNELTKGQYARINYGALKFRNYITFPEGASPLQLGGEEEPLAIGSEQPAEIINSTNEPSTIAKPKPTPVEEIEISSTPSGPTRTLSGELMLQIADQKVSTTLDGNLYKTTDSYYSGTNYELFIKNNQKAYVYVVGSDLTKKSELLFPLDYNTPALTQSFSKFALPGNGRMYTLDEFPGKDYLLVLYSTKELPIKNLMYMMKREEGNFVQRLYKVMGDDLVPINEINYSKEGALSFEATATTRDVVPILLELDHL